MPLLEIRGVSQRIRGNNVVAAVSLRRIVTLSRASGRP